MTYDAFTTASAQDHAASGAASANSTAGANTMAGASTWLGASGSSGSMVVAAGAMRAGVSPAGISPGAAGAAANQNSSQNSSLNSGPNSGQNPDQSAEQNGNESAGQELLNRQIEQHMRQQEAARHEQWQKQVSQWREEVAQDPQLGGVHMAANVARAQLALDRFDQGRHIGKLLEESGYGNHPEVLRFFNRVADALMEDSLVRGEPGGGMPPLEERMYAGWSSRK